jgi:asparagine synthase (glutamine-hydrolysing)
MCGIAGSINFSLNEQRIKDTMFHRGPDAQNGYVYNNVELFHMRLSIVDLAGGQQPMHLNNYYSLIFNGEIYNYKELNKKFNLNPKTNSDTETILLLYEKIGLNFLKETDGMFAMALLDKKKNQLILSRDRAGKKPCYYSLSSENLVFASELNCIKSLVTTEIDENNIAQYLRLGSLYKKATPYTNIQELPAGTNLIVDLNSLDYSLDNWWNIQSYSTVNKDLNLSTATNKIESLLHRAIKRRMLASDLEVGSFLSGGIDSGLVTSIASEYTDNLKTFTVCFPGAYNEGPLAKLVADKYNTNHHELNINFNNLQNDIESILLNYGEPFYDSSAVPSYYVSKAAKEFVTVVINGDGADELFGGYRRYVPFSKKDWFNTSSLITKSSSAFKNLLPFPKDKKSKYNYLYRFLDFVSKEGKQMYLTATVDIFEGFESFLLNQNSEDPLSHDLNEIIRSNKSGIEKLMLMDFSTILFSDLLVKMDIATMASSLEGRSPFLAKELLEFAPTLPSKLRVNGSQTKVALRKLAQKYLPAELIHQPKRGFEIPLKNWVERELKDIINDYLLAPNAYWKNFIHSKWFLGVIENSMSIPPEKRAKMLWTVFSLEVWHRNLSKT